jgi:hypothetical protein
MERSPVPRWVMVFMNVSYIRRPNSCSDRIGCDVPLPLAIVDALLARTLVALKANLVPPHSWLSITVVGLSGKQGSPLFLRTAKVCLLNLCDLLIIERDRSTPVSLFTDEIKLRRWLMTT